MYAGLIPIVICPLGIEKPVDLKADISLPCDSLIDESHRPITENDGMPGEIDTSIKATVESAPVAKQEYSLATLGLDAISDPPF